MKIRLVLFNVIMLLLLFVSAFTIDIGVINNDLESAVRGMVGLWCFIVFYMILDEIKRIKKNG